MRTSQSNAHHLVARATSGGRLDIGYDPETHSIVFMEADWGVDVRGGASPRAVFREQLDTAKVKRLSRRRAA